MKNSLPSVYLLWNCFPKEAISKLLIDVKVSIKTIEPR